MTRTLRLSVIALALFATTHRLPAPISEIAESPTPAPEQSAKPKPKRTSKPKVTSDNSENSTKHRMSSSTTSEKQSDRNLSSSFTIPQSQMTASATSEHPGMEARKAIDGNSKTFWSTPWSLFGPLISLPQSITLNLGGIYNVNQLRYLPRQDIWQNGNIVTYRVYASTDGTNFTQITTGNWADDHTEKSATFAPTRASYIRLEAVAGHEGHVVAAELNVTATR